MRSEIIVIGDSGHAKVCIELLRAMGQRIAYCVGVTDAETCLGIPVLRGDEHLARLRAQGYDQAFVAVGVNATRRRLAAMVKNLGFRLVNAISPQAVVSPSAHLGEGIAVMAGAVINADTVIGNLVIVNTGACIDHDCHIGDAAHIAPTCGLAGNVAVGAESFLGIGCKVIPGVSIGSEVVLGAGTVVIDNIPDKVRAVGVPARVI
ncbi:acetyltransferase [uncultured Pigmentiphaga sp.]|jgi:sugar O-acyltransferase, sialic acid O-acetyltransferase NeuD family|uniref:acetyltransferase n=1 Tax=uncultured Pigmentiphaga sp. TaxID=340361 RepID=UPI002611969E|nr:acetyltransferase [uncultured Pigmentiphaga sp.]